MSGKTAGALREERLQRLDDAYFLRGIDAGINTNIGDAASKIGLGHGRQLRPGDHQLAIPGDTDTPGYRERRARMIRTFEAQGRYVSALATTRQALAYYPLSEELQDQLARHEALAAGGAAGL
mgnify:CR=1 FL=1